MFSLDNIPPEQHLSVTLHLQNFTDSLQYHTLELPKNTLLISTLPKVFCCSEFVALTCIRHPEYLLRLVSNSDLFNPSIHLNYSDQIHSYPFENDIEVLKILRQFRNQHMLRIAWRDLSGWSELDETLSDLTALAESCIQFALDYLYQQACNKFGIPTLTDGSAQNIVVLGMGKLGAWELNFSSDIDLIFAYQQEGVLADRKKTSYGEFFSRLCQKLVKFLDETTVDGFVFRTDIRLRPFGDSGPIIMTFDGLENYYQTQARDWERYAMIKARPVAGDQHGGEQFMTFIKPFIYRRYLDYGAFEEIRSLKQQMTQELQRKDRLDNIKLGPGGIREIEFIGQAFQLIRGGKDTTLQARRIQLILKRLGEKNLISEKESHFLISAYRFLRRVENRLQEYQDKQTHNLPKSTQGQNLLAYSLDYPNWDNLQSDLEKIRTQVHQIFSQVFSLKKTSDIPHRSQQIWMEHAEDKIRINQLRKLGYSTPTSILTLLYQFKQTPAIKRLTQKSAKMLDQLMPKMIDLLAGEKNSEITLQRLCSIFESMAGRSSYLSLLVENDHALKQLITLAAASPWISQYLSQYPVLFDDLLDTRSLYEPLEKKALQLELAQKVSSIESGDIEQFMITLRQFKQTHLLRIAASDIMNALPLMVVSDYLSYIADAILEQSVKISWSLVVEKYGLPPNTDEQQTHFGIVGLGKLGGQELSYRSDLDLIFIYHYPNDQTLTNGHKKISSLQFYVALGQRIRSLLNTQMLSGRTYEIDLRLRPNGESGLLVTSLSRYEDYLKQEAWTWEHQALVRGRFITGDCRTKKDYAYMRHHILCLARDKEHLRQEVREMREKMRKTLDNSNQHIFDLKQGSGGMVDIEFIVQFYILAESKQHSELTKFTDNIRSLTQLAEYNLLSQSHAHVLKQAYYLFRDQGHKETLQGHKAFIAQDKLIDIRHKVSSIWHELIA